MVENFNLTAMKQYISIFAAGVTVLLSAVSCNKESISSVNTLSATASISECSGTKCTYTDLGSGNALKVDWASSESFKAYFTGGSSPLVFSKKNSGSFVATDVPEGVSASTPFVGIYGEKATYDPATGKYSVDFSGQDGTLENLARYDVMVASSTIDAEGLHFPFAHKCAFLRITLQDDAYTEGSHKDSDSSAEGRKDFKIKFSNCTLADNNMSVSGFTSGAFTVSFKLKTELADNEKRVIYVAIPAMSLTKKSGSLGFSGGTMDIVGEGYHKTVNANVTFEAGKVYETTITYFCGTAHDLPQW
ncbi:MAG: fimbrillin family protein [Bacteroidaceae bacterium]|nr:fimbrillin family protein [Bacteroidaceae bacterium]